jgi:hypothetical protein
VEVANIEKLSVFEGAKEVATMRFEADRFDFCGNKLMHPQVRLTVSAPGRKEVSCWLPELKDLERIYKKLGCK